MPKKPLLSICIPTYNREKYLKRLLDSIVSQKEFTDSDDVEIVIDDGPSKDNTEVLVQEYKAKFWKKIRYFRNPVAIGMCPAFLEAIELSEGEYTWLFGSDDVMSDRALWETLRIILQEAPNVILSERGLVSNEGKLISLANSSDLILNWVDEFIQYLPKDVMNGNFFTYISIFCFRQDTYRRNKSLLSHERPNDYSNLSKNYFNFALVIFYNLFTDKIVIIRNSSLVFVQQWNNGWSFSSLNIFNDLYLLVKIFRSKYKINMKCNYFFNNMLFYWLMPSIWWIMKNHKIWKLFYKPLSKIFFYVMYIWRKSGK